jgi:DNA-binding GntR family transcriptional regulator
MADRNATKSETICDALERDILFGRLRPRERLIEDELIARLDATRHQVRQALVELERRGLVVRPVNRGALVRDFTAEEIAEIGTVRELLHAEAARTIPLPAPPGLLAELERHQARHDAAKASGDVVAVHRANNDFHATLFSACGNRYLAQTIADYADLSLAYRCHLMAIASYTNRAAEEHRAMIAALRDGDREALVTLCVDHTRPALQVYRALRGWDDPGNINASLAAPARPRRSPRPGAARADGPPARSRKSGRRRAP